MRPGPIPKVVDVEEIEGAEERAVDGVSTKHCSTIEHDRAPMGRYYRRYG